jgi:hypothetical protein
MNKEFVTYEQALALKELGFNEPCFGYYIETKEWIPASYSQKGTIYPSNSDLMKEWVSASLYQQAFRWFREKYKIEATISCFYNKRLDIPYEERQYHCYIIRDGVTSKGPKYKTYEEAEQACLNKLIEICKTK